MKKIETNFYNVADTNICCKLLFFYLFHFYNIEYDA